MHERKVTLVVDVKEIVVVLVDLNRRQLSLVDNVLVRKRANVEPVVQANNVCSTLAHDIQLALEVPGVIGLLEVLLGLPPVSVGSLENNEGLQNDGLSGERSGTKESGVTRDDSPSQHS